MTESMQIDPKIVHHEQLIQMEFLKQRVLTLAQALAERTAQRDEAIGERDRLSSELDELRDEIRINGELQETADGNPE
ncbi:hypothetical protein JZX87_13880 [Agrobacterium sp. Ap1]|uniref:hypothetical protein n=1 Tax=Agrobacterium sp. Ap1 TaxID=2815337 RepID=UPI001A8E9FE2|nr:hypothetical protein [Agrobacterium sp. Ap1]MBO0142252.1 hypothetical protein [Agrobacterium sp. Ap1]